ncbi:hypothetical protein KJ782_06780, partial [Patescibacteria group bacterium]|nr:hypothetical protein [Patescibacteria group bacterium]
NAKTGSRTAYLTARATAMLKSRTQGKPSQLLFPKRTKTKEGASAQASKSFARVVKTLKLNQGITDRKQKVTFHTLRHNADIRIMPTPSAVFFHSLVIPALFFFYLL